jgi:hypothetical protein
MLRVFSQDRDCSERVMAMSRFSAETLRAHPIVCIAHNQAHQRFSNRSIARWFRLCPRSATRK